MLSQMERGADPSLLPGAECGFQEQSCASSILTRACRGGIGCLSQQQGRKCLGEEILKLIHWFPVQFILLLEEV